MICYRDMTFCGSKNCKGKCGRQVTQEVIDGGTKWWGGSDFPIALAEFCDENGEVINYG